MSKIRDIIENERGLHTDTVATDSELAAVDTKVDTNVSRTLSTVTSNVLLSGNIAIDNTVVTKNFATVLYTGNGSTQDIETGISSVDFTVSGNGSGYWLDRSTFEVKTDAGDVVASGSCEVNLSKVHIKSRSVAYDNSIFDSLRGTDNFIISNSATAEGSDEDYNITYLSDGISIPSGVGINADTETYVAYQTLYTHVKWGKTNQNKKYVEAYNPITRETMIMYEGSGNAGHEIPHSLGVLPEYAVSKNLSNASSWLLRTSEISLRLNTDAADYGVYRSHSEAYFESVDNDLNDAYILYGKAKSENWTIVEYTGTGASGNFVETKDVYGVTRKPARIIVKRVDDVGSWIVIDSKRGLGTGINIQLSTANEEGASAYNVIYVASITNTGFTLNANYTPSNATNGRYIALVEFDTNGDGGDGYFNKPTASSNLNVSGGVFSYTNGKDANGYVRSTESYTGVVDFTGVSDGIKWIAKTKDTGWSAFDGRIMNRLYEKEHADDNRLVFNPTDGKVYTTTGGELVTNGTFDTDISGWTASTGATLSVSNGQLAVAQTTADGVYAYQALVCEVGKVYKVKYGIGGGTAPYIQVNKTLGYVTLDGTQQSCLTEGEYTFVADNTTMYVHLVNWTSTDNTTSYFDNISVYKLEPTLDQPLTTPVSFLPNPVMVANETPQYIDYSQELYTNVTDSLEVGKLSVTDGFDLGQKWVDETANRALDVTYTNTTGKPIMVAVFAGAGIDAGNVGALYIDGVQVGSSNNPSSAMGVWSYGIVPNSSTVEMRTLSGTPSSLHWRELK